MNLPSPNKTALPKAIAILATIGILAFGLCTASVVIALPDSYSKWVQFAMPLCAITFVASMIAVAVLIKLYNRRTKRNR